MKSKNLKIGHLIFVVAFLLFSFKLRGQNFITQWTFGKATNQIHFNAESTDSVTYTWIAFPSGNNGSGIFIQTIAGPVTLSNIVILPGDTINLSMNPSKLRRFYIDNGPDKTNLINVIQWGSVPWTSMNSAFNGCVNLKIYAMDSPDLSNVVDLSFMFAGASSFNQDIGNWNTTNVSSMSNMFNHSSSFNQDIGNWNTSKVTDMSYMFSWDTSFNQNIANWNISNVNNMEHMFEYAWAFNQDIGNWNTSMVTNMGTMFYAASSFNQNIGNWNTSRVIYMANMFSYARSFNQNIGGWNVENVQYMDFMFRNASVFNQDIGSWNVSKVGSMAFAFYNATSFNQDIGNWNTSNVKSMWNMFYGAKSFNKYIGGWNTSNVTNMYGMFRGASSFNQDIGNWNTSNVKNMSIMFDHASSFNQNLGKWKLMENVGLANTLDYSGLDCYHYSNTLIGWLSNNPTIKYIKLGSYGLQYGTNAEIARNTLVNSQGWTINGDSPSGKDCATVGIHNEESITDLFLYPNPTSGILNIEDHNGSIYSISDLAGKVVDSGKITMNTISLEMLPLGIYYLTIINSDSPQTIKVFKY